MAADHTDEPKCTQKGTGWDSFETSQNPRRKKNNKEDYQKESKTILEQIKVPNRIPSESKIISIEDICLPGTKLWWNSSKIAKDIPIRREP